MKTSIEYQNIMAKLAKIESGLAAIATDEALLKVQRQGLEDKKKDLEDCLVHKPKFQSIPPAADKPPGRPRKKAMIENDSPTTARWRCKDCGQDFPKLGVAKDKSPCCPHDDCGSLQIEEIKVKEFFV